MKDKNNTEIKNGDLLVFKYPTSEVGVIVVERDGKLGVESGRDFVPLSETDLEHAEVQG